MHPELWWHLSLPRRLILGLLFAAGLRALRVGGHHGDALGVAMAAAVVRKGWTHLGTAGSVHVLAVCVTLSMLAHIAGAVHP